MLIVQALLTLAARSVGRVLTMAFGWATVMLFGRVPQERQIFLSVVVLGSVVWLVAALGVAFPSAATFILAFVTLPPWVNHAWIRIAMVILALIVPPLVGEAARRAVDPGTLPLTSERLTAVALDGYRCTLGIAFALLALLIAAPVLVLRGLLRRWQTLHVPVLIRHADYAGVADGIQRALEAGGIPVIAGELEGLLRVPASILSLAAGNGIRGLETRITRLARSHIELLLYPFDLVISGRPDQVFRARSLAAQHLPRAPAYMTWTARGNAIEDRLKRLWHRDTEAGGTRPVPDAEIASIAQDLSTAPVPYEEWEVLAREMLLLERDLGRAS